MNYFPNVPKVTYEGPDSTNPFSFKYYDPDRLIHGKSMKEHLKFAMSYWHTPVSYTHLPYKHGVPVRIPAFVCRLCFFRGKAV